MDNSDTSIELRGVNIRSSGYGRYESPINSGSPIFSHDEISHSDSAEELLPSETADTSLLNHGIGVDIANYNLDSLSDYSGDDQGRADSAVNGNSGWTFNFIIGSLWSNFDFLTSSYLNLGFGVLPFSVLALYYQWSSIAIFILAILSLTPCLWQVIWLTGQITAAFSRIGRFQFIGCFIHFFFTTFNSFLGGIFFLCVPQNEVIVQAGISGTISLMFLCALSICFIINVQRNNLLRESNLLPCPTLEYTENNLQQQPNPPEQQPQPQPQQQPLEPKKFKSSLHYLSTICLLSVAIVGVCSFFDIPNGNVSGVLVLSRWLSIVLLISGLCFAFFKYSNSAFFEKSNYQEGEKLGLVGSLIGLIIATFFVGFEYYLLSISVLDVGTKWGLSTSFLGAVVIPIVTLTPTQIILFRHSLKGSLQAAIEEIHIKTIELLLVVSPLWALLSWAVNTISLISDKNQQDSLNDSKGQSSSIHFSEVKSFGFRFSTFNIFILCSVLIVHKFLLSVGRPKFWLTGIIMMMLYTGLCIGYFFHP